MMQTPIRRISSSRIYLMGTGSSSLHRLLVEYVLSHIVNLTQVLAHLVAAQLALAEHLV